MIAVKGKRLNLWLPGDEWEDKINELMAYLDSQGVNLQDPKKGGYSQSALFRHLVEEALKNVKKGKRQ